MPLILIGVGHVFRIGDALQALLVQERPDVVALELDPRRYQGLLAREQGQKPSDAETKQLPRAYRAMAKFQEQIAESYGVEVGSEMVAAIRAAQAIGAPVALVDRPADDAVRRLWKEMGFWEKLRLVGSGFASSLSFRRQTAVEEEIRRYHRDPTTYLEEVGRKFPTVKRILLDERNTFMAENLRKLSAERRVAAVVGDGHVDGLLGLLQDLRPRVVRLKDFQGMTPAASGVRWDFGAAGDRVRYSFDQRIPNVDFRRAP